MKATLRVLNRVLNFYIEGFRNMTWGRTLWLIILLKLFIMFVVLRIFFFQPVLSGLDEQEKQDAVAKELMLP